MAGLLNLVCIYANVSCGSRPTPEPTVDVKVLATMRLKPLKRDLQKPSLAKPTDTPQPTYTPVSYKPTTSSASITLPTAGTGGSVSIPTIAQQPTAIVNLPTATLSAVGDKAVWADQSIKDGTHFAPGESADLTWYITNVGTTTWTTDYSIRFFTGTNFAKAGNTRYYLPKPVAPQETGQVTIDIVAPTTPGEYKMAWVLSNAEDHNFYTVDITIIVD